MSRAGRSPGGRPGLTSGAQQRRAMRPTAPGRAGIWLAKPGLHPLATAFDIINALDPQDDGPREEISPFTNASLLERANEINADFMSWCNRYGLNPTCFNLSCNAPTLEQLEWDPELPIGAHNRWKAANDQTEVVFARGVADLSIDVRPADSMSLAGGAFVRFYPWQDWELYVKYPVEIRMRIAVLEKYGLLKSFGIDRKWLEQAQNSNRPRKSKPEEQATGQQEFLSEIQG